MAAVRKFVRLLVEDNLVDEPSCLGIGRGQPGYGRAGQLLLHRLQEALKIPDRKDVMLHEQPEPVGTVDQGVERVVNQALAGRPQIDRTRVRGQVTGGLGGGGVLRPGIGGGHGEGSGGRAGAARTAAIVVVGI